MGVFGQLLGSALGSLGSALFPIPGADGQKIGSHIGSLLPFQQGGMVPARPRRRYQKSAKKPASKRKSRKKK